MTRRLLYLLLLPCLVIAGLLGVSEAASAAPPGTPAARHVAGVPTVGPLFAAGLGNDHDCTASVVASPTRDLLITAAHCISGTGAGVLFVPGYDRGRTPYGVWTVRAAYVARAWRTEQDPQRDYAILRVAPQRRDGRTVRVQDVTGAELLRVAPAAGTPVTVPAYPAGIDDRPIRCTAPVYYTSGFPGFNCRGYFGGTSGSPFLQRIGGTGYTAVSGVIGGLHQGGCVAYTSYSPRFGLDVYLLWLRAVSGAPGDIVPRAGGDGC